MTPADGPRWLSAGEHEVAEHDAWLTPSEAARLERMRFPKRRLESRLGRWTAKNAVAGALGLASDAAGLRRISIVNAADGAPEAFVDGDAARLAISMTDRAGWAVSITRPGGRAVGCDLEVIEPRSTAFLADYLTTAEQDLVTAGDAACTANLIWSAKESALKVLRTGLRRDTRSVEVDLMDGSQDGWERMAVTDVTNGRRFPGWWRRFGVFILTIAGEEDDPPPASLIEPPPLETAEPIHSWMGHPPC